MVMVSKILVKQCHKKLLKIKSDLLNQLHGIQHNLSSSEPTRGGDEADQAISNMNEKFTLTSHERLRYKLFEVERALVRIEQNRYGFCEETQEPIEPERLKVNPETCLSVEGAEIREATNKKYANR